MKKSVYWLAVAVLLSSSSVFANPDGPQDFGAEQLVLRSVTQVERAFYRRQSLLDSSGLRAAAPSSIGNLFPAYGFQVTSPLLGTTLSAIDSEKSTLCVSFQATSRQQWKGAVSGFFRKGMTQANSSCQAIGKTDAPAAYPAYAYGVKVLDSQDVPARTIIPAYPVLSGADSAAVTKAGVTIHVSGPGQTGSANITVYNPLVVISTNPTVYKTTGIASASIRSGFAARQNCSTIGGGSACVVTIDYTNNGEAYKVGQLRLEFVTGEVAVIGVLGVRGGVSTTGGSTSTGGTTTGGTTTGTTTGGITTGGTTTGTTTGGTTTGGTTTGTTTGGITTGGTTTGTTTGGTTTGGTTTGNGCNGNGNCYGNANSTTTNPNGNGTSANGNSNSGSNSSANHACNGNGNCYGLTK